MSLSTETPGSFFEEELNVSKTMGVKIANILLHFTQENEYDEESISDDLEDGYQNSSLVDEIAEAIKWTTDDQKQAILSALIKIYLNKLSDLDWVLAKDAIQLMRDYMDIQCPKMIKDGEDKDMITVMAVGLKNEQPDLLCTIYDSFTKYRTNEKSSSNNYQPVISHKEFCSKHQSFNGVSQNKRECIEKALISYEARFIPPYKFTKHEELYVDRCSAFIEYTIMVANAIQNYVATQKDNAPVTPLQVDLLIIPKGIIKVSSMEKFTGEDDDDDDDDIKIDDTNKVNKEFSETIDKVLGRENYDKHDINFEGKDPWRKLVEFFVKYIAGKNRRRVSIIIDRRTEPNTVYFYIIPHKKSENNEPNYSEIPVNYCASTLVYLSGHFAFPIWDKQRNKAGKFPFVGGTYAPGKYFVVSYHIMDKENTRLQWSFFGNGICLTPKLMVKEWPKVFQGQTLENEYTEEYVRGQMKFWD